MDDIVPNTSTSPSPRDEEHCSAKTSYDRQSGTSTTIDCSCHINGGYHHGTFIAPEAGHRQGDARIQARRTQEWAWRQRRQGQEPQAGHRDRPRGSRASKYESERRNRRNLRRTESKEASGRTAQQEREGKSHIGASRKRESTRAMAGKNARKPTARGSKAAAARARKSDGHTRQELYAKARRRHIEGRSRMTKRQLENALGMS
jgi:hypothetical protein